VEKILSKQNLFILAIQDAFISILPYIILSSLLVVTHQLGLYLFPKNNLEVLLQLSKLLSDFFPLLLMFSITYHLSNRYLVNSVSAISLSFAIVITLSILENDHVTLKTLYNLSFLSILIPISTVFMLHFHHQKNTSLYTIHSELSKAIQTIIPFIVIFITSVLCYFLILEGLHYLLNEIQIDIPNHLSLLLKSIISHLLWFLGIHGGNTVAALIGEGFMAEPIINQLSHREFYNLFVIFGGSGAVLALIIAILIASKYESTKNIAKLSFPFSFFNISEVIIFALPIVFNKKLLLPFVLIPILNFILAYFILYTFFPDIDSTSVAWVIPIFLNTYLSFDGNLWMIALQAFLLTIDILIYIPFIKDYRQIEDIEPQLSQLTKHLQINQEFNAKRDINMYKAQSEIIEASRELENIITLISENSLLLYYQPIVNIHNGTKNYEALLRLKLANGEIRGPYFLNEIEIAGFAPIIDFWVIKEVARTLKEIDREKLGNSSISINLHPDTLNNTQIILQTINLLKGETIKFEILERDFLNNSNAKNNLLLLEKNGFKISMDDLGEGYSSYTMLYDLPLDTVKIDKSLIDEIANPNAQKVVKHIIQLCKDLGYTIIVEGVETESQYLLIKTFGADYVQGFYFSKPLSLTKALNFKAKL
jgi:lactose/cellobiose-specific phosphotransferase system IIC component